MSQVKIRRMNPGDLETVTILCGQLGYPTEEETTAKRFLKINTDFKQTIFVAENEKEEVVGFIHAKETISFLFDLRVEICSLVVDDQCRGKGVGSLLMKQIDIWAKERGLNTIHFTSRATRTEAHKLYQRLGYEITKTSHWFQKIL